MLRTLVAGTEGGALGARSKVGGEEAGREEDEGGDEERIQGGEEGRRDKLAATAAAKGGRGRDGTQSDSSGGRSGIPLHRLLGEGGGGG